MARIKNGEPKPGINRTCVSCGKEKYHAPSQIKKVEFKCQECRIKDAFNFPCFVCSTPIFVTPATLRLRCRSTCKPECRKILARRRAEEKRGGYTKHQLDRLARYSPEAETWRKAVFERDDYTCQTCDVRGSYLEADHIQPWAYFPELRFELSNGRTLCRPCHDKTKMSAKRMKEIYGTVDNAENHTNPMS